MIFRIFLIFSLYASTCFAQQRVLNDANKVLSNISTIVNQAEQKVAEIDAVSQAVQAKDGGFKTLLDGKSLTFPIGLLPAGQDRKYAIYIHGIALTPQGVTAQVSMKIAVDNNQALYFYADKVPFSGNGFSGDNRLYLLKDFNAKFGNGYNVKFNGLGSKATDSTFVTFDCKGFKDLMLNGNLTLSPKVAKVSKDDSPTAATTSKGDSLDLKFYVQADRISNFIVNFNNIPTLEFTAIKGVKVIIPSLTLDMSEIREAPNVKLPAWYTNLDSYKGTYSSAASWQGLYVPSTKVIIPQGIKGDKASDTIMVSMKELIVDQNGLTFNSTTTNVLDINKSNNKGIKMSIDTLILNLECSSITKAGLAGMVSFPVAKTVDALKYRVVYSYNSNTDVSTLQGGINLKFKKGFKAVSFGPSYLELSHAGFDFVYENKAFYPAVTLSGQFTLAASTKSKSEAKTDNASASTTGTPSSVPQSDDAQKAEKGSVGSEGGFGTFVFNFTNLKFATRGQMLSCDAFGLSQSGGSLAKLPISIFQVDLDLKDPAKVGVTIGVRVKLSKSSGSSAGNGFTGSTVFTVWADKDVKDNRWKLSYAEINRIDISLKNGSFSLEGSLSIFKDDPLWGKGYCGNLSISILDKITIKAAAIFGKTGGTNCYKVSNTPYESILTKNPGNAPDALPTTPPPNADSADTQAAYRYWFVDAAVNFAPGIPFFTGVGLTGFNGGIYQQMKLVYGASPSDTNVCKSKVECKTASGNVYMPNPNISLGIMAGLSISSMPNDAVFTGNVTFSIEFNKGGGIAMVACWGYVGVFKPPGFKTTAADKLPADQTGTEPEKATGSSQGLSELAKYKVGLTWFIMYRVDEKIFIGDFGVYINFPPIAEGVKDKRTHKAGDINVYFSPSKWYIYMGKPMSPNAIEIFSLARIESYLCVGALPSPSFRPLPARLQNRPGFDVDESLLDGGFGMSFGVRLAIGKRFEKDFGIGRAWLDAGVEAGFDILMSKTKIPVYCSGVGVRGFENWYATGQAFLLGYLDGGASVFGIGVSLSLQLDAVVFAQLPKPTYLKGSVGFSGSVSVDLGITSVSKSFDFNLSVTFGDQCESNEDDKVIKMFNYSIPANQETKVQVTKPISLYFLKGINTYIFKMPNESGGGNLECKPTIDLSKLKLTYLKAGTPTNIQYTPLWSAGNTVLTLSPKQVLPENTEISVEFTIEIRNVTNNAVVGDPTKFEKVNLVYTTNYEPTFIEKSNIQLSYPLVSMQNYYKGESSRGFIKLGTIPQKALQKLSTEQFELQIVEGGKVIAANRSVVINASLGAKNITYEIPNTKLALGKNYTFRIVRVPIQSRTDSIENKTENTVIGYQNLNLTSKMVEFEFATSKFATFAQKISLMNNVLETFNPPVVTQTLSFKKEVLTKEGFMDGEVKKYVTNGAEFDPLVRPVNYTIDGTIKTVQENDFKLVPTADGVIVDAKMLLGNNIPVAEYLQMLVDQRTERHDINYRLGYFIPGESVPTSSVSFVLD